MSQRDDINRACFLCSRSMAFRPKDCVLAQRGMCVVLGKLLVANHFGRTMDATEYRLTEAKAK